MTMITLPQPWIWPGLTPEINGALAMASGTTLDAAGEYDTFIFVPTENMAVTHVMIRPSSVAGSPTVTAQLESVDTNGAPSGTVLGATNNAKVTSGVLTAAVTILALGEVANLVAGTPYAFKVLYNSGTSIVTRFMSNFWTTNLPYRYINTGTPAKAAYPGMEFALGSSSTTWYSIPYVWPIETITNTSFTNTNSAARGNKLTMPFKARIAGIVTASGASLGNFNAILQDGSNNNLESTAFDGDVNRGTTHLLKILPFANKVIVNLNDVIRFGLEPTSATAVNYTQFTLAGADFLRAMPGGASFQGSARASGVWTDDADKLYPMDLLIDQIDDGAGSGGGGAGAGGWW